MVTTTLTNQTSAAERDSAEAQAARLLREGELVIMPTETVYGLFADATNPDAIERLARVTIPEDEKPPRYRYTWHAPSLAAVLDAVPIDQPSHRLLLHRLLPGPVRVDVALGEAETSGVLKQLGVGPGVLEHEGELALRVPSHQGTRRVLELVGQPVVANRLATAGWSPDRTVDAAMAHAEGAGVAMVVDDGPARFGGPSTLLSLLPDGGYRIDAEGAYDTRMVEQRARFQILFVCTGNTCRSPMAEAIGRHLARAVETPTAGSAVSVRVVSAGTSAAAGAPASPQTVAALEEVGVEPLPHRSRPLSRSLIAESDAIYTMSGWHREEIVALDPSASSRTWLLDPAGQDVPDPVGLPQAVYNQTAARLAELIGQRFAELGVLGPDGERKA